MSLLVFDLISRTIELLRRQEELNRRTFAEAVAPILSAFDDVHRDYLATFRKYFDGLTSRGDVSPNAIVAEIAADSLFSVNLRDRLRLLAESGSDARLQPLVTAIRQYLAVATAGPLKIAPEHLIEIETDDVLAISRYENVTRIIAVDNIEAIQRMQLPQRERNMLTAQVVREIVRRLQKLHRNVAEAYMRLTVDLLRNK